MHADLKPTSRVSRSFGACKGQLASFEPSWAMTKQQFPARQLSALSAAFFLCCQLDLNRVRRVAKTEFPMLVECIGAMQTCCLYADMADMLRWCKALFSTSRLAFENASGNGDFVVPKPYPKMCNFYVAPTKHIRPLLDQLDAWDPLYEANMLAAFGDARDLLDAICEHAGEEELCNLMYFCCSVTFVCVAWQYNVFDTRDHLAIDLAIGMQLAKLQTEMSNFMVILMEHCRIRAMSQLNCFFGSL